MAEGSSPIEYEWSKIGGVLPPTASDVQGMLEITVATAADAGEYRCTCTNAAGTREAYATIDVYGKYMFVCLLTKQHGTINLSIYLLC